LIILIILGEEYKYSLCIGVINRKYCFQSREGIPAAIKSIMSRQTSYLAWSVYVCESYTSYDLWRDLATCAALKKLFRYLIRIKLNTIQKKKLWAELSCCADSQPSTAFIFRSVWLHTYAVIFFHAVFCSSVL
jgi:hypothetical protein